MLKLNRKELSDALLWVTMYEFRNVPSEASIDHSFSEDFQDAIAKISRRSENAVWRLWQAPLKRAILIALLTAILLATVACATPAIREAIIDFFFSESADGKSYVITFDPEQAANAPRKIEEYWLPTYETPDYALILQEKSSAGVVFAWMNENSDIITYSQLFIPENANETNWLGIDAEDVYRDSKVINGYQVEIVSNLELKQYTAIWTDNRYIYRVEVSNDNTTPDSIVISIMESLVKVDASTSVS